MPAGPASNERARTGLSEVSGVVPPMPMSSPKCTTVKHAENAEAYTAVYVSSPPRPYLTRRARARMSVFAHFPAPATGLMIDCDKTMASLYRPCPQYRCTPAAIQVGRRGGGLTCSKF